MSVGDFRGPGISVFALWGWRRCCWCPGLGAGDRSLRVVLVIAFVKQAEEETARLGIVFLFFGPLLATEGGDAVEEELRARRRLRHRGG
jgi:hypothetical protein